jgi:hypothetical protein
MPSRGQSITLSYTAWDTAANVGKAGDGGNHILRWVKDGTAAAPTNAPAEVDAANAPGIYKLALTAAECTCHAGTLAGKSSTAGVVLIPLAVTFEQLPTAAPAAADGLPTVGTGAGQVAPAGGKVAATVAAGDDADAAAIAADYQQRAVAVTLPTTPPAGYGGSLDAAALWGADLPGAYPAGSAGALLGLVPDVELLAATILQGITELLTTGGGGGGSVTGPVDLSAGAVAAVAGAILVTAANKLRSDAQGRVELAPGGLEQVPVGDAGGNARHALDAIYSAQAHDVQASPASGPGHVTIGPPGDPRIEADVDGLGNRSNVTVTRRELP